jgi:hypothetical protein
MYLHISYPYYLIYLVIYLLISTIEKMNQDISSSPQTPQQIYTDSPVVPNAPLRVSKNGGHLTHNIAGLLQPIQLNFDNVVNTNVNTIVNINWKG